MKEILIIAHPLPNSNIPSSLRVNGYQLSNYINKITPSKCLCLNIDEISSLENKNIIFLGSLITGLKLNQDILTKLKKQNNTIILNPIDDLCYKSDKQLQEEVDVFDNIDGVVFPNEFVKDYFKDTYNKSNQSIVLPHPYDDTFNKMDINQSRPFKVSYVGSSYENFILSNPPSWLTLDQTGNVNSIFQLLVDSPVHFSHRESNTIDFHFKPSSKLSVASSCNSPMIMSKDKSFIDLLPDYPLYVNDSIDDVNEKYELAKSWYGTDKWDELLDLMNEIKYKTSLDTISKQYINYLNNF